MRTYTNVLFDREEKQVLERATLHLGVTFPEIHEAAPKKKADRPADDARVMLRLSQDPNLGTHANCVAARRVLEALLDQCERESELDYWLGAHEAEKGERPAESSESTSTYQNYVMLASIRQGQADDVRQALEIVHNAARVTTAPAYEDKLAGV